MGVPPPSDADGSSPESQTYHRAGSWTKPVLVGILALASYAFARWRPFRVEVTGTSMRPALEPGDWALGVTARRPRPGDIVVLEHPERHGLELVKRVTRVAGDDRPDGGKLGDREVWVEGDDPERSTDSRHFGPVRVADVRGRLVLVWWPPARRTFL